MRSPASRVQTREIQAISSGTGKMRSLVQLDCTTSPSSRARPSGRRGWRARRRHDTGPRRVRVERLRHRELPQGPELLLAVGDVLAAGHAGDVGPRVGFGYALPPLPMQTTSSASQSTRTRPPGTRCRPSRRRERSESFVKTTGSSGGLRADSSAWTTVVEAEREDLRGSRNRRRGLRLRAQARRRGRRSPS